MDSRSVASQAEKRMMSLIKEISPLPRLINTPGLDRTFDIIRREMPDVVIHEYPSGTECGDWIVPEKWCVEHGVMKDASGSVIASTDTCYLFVAPYSEPVDGWFTKEEIATHLRTRPDRPDAFALEHRNAYDFQLVDWGITLPHTLWEKLPQGEYHIRIDVDRRPGNMKVAEYFLEGHTPETLCICAHIDELCNDNLSGCVVAMELMRVLETMDVRQYSYQMLLVPEMFGALFYAYNNPEKIRRTFGMLNLETLGAGDGWVLKQTLSGEEKLDRLLRHALHSLGTAHKEVGFFEGYGNDERVYAWPGIDIPGIALQRFPFPEYHTSDDTPDIIKSTYLMEALKICETCITILEQDYVPGYTGTLPPWLTRNGLYYDAQNDPEKFQRFNNRVLYHLNGRRSVLDLAETAGLDFFEVHGYLSRFLDKGFIEKRLPGNSGI